MFSLAPCRYRHVMQLNGGPIERLQSGRIWSGGRQIWQTNATLTEGLTARRNRVIYSHADGSGSNESEAVATHMAISEAMERWAYFQTVKLRNQRNDYGFREDPSSNGMAAFPGLLARQARRSARLEGIERFTLLSWWEGHLDGYVIDTDWPGIRAVIIPGQPGGFVAITFKQTGPYAYVFGHGAEETISEACRRGMTEMERHERVIKHWRELRASEAPTELLERRALFFAGPKGAALFEQRLARRAWAGPIKWETICDAEIKGPWSQYAMVWRHAYRPPSGAFMQPRDDYFFW
jgi:hypothetical protein